MGQKIHKTVGHRIACHNIILQVSKGCLVNSIHFPDSNVAVLWRERTPAPFFDLKEDTDLQVKAQKSQNS